MFFESQMEQLSLLINQLPLDYILALSIFFLSILLFFFEKVEKTLVASLGALLLIVFGVVSWEEAIHSINFEILALLIGLMLVVGVAHHSGLFSLVNSKIATISKGNPIMVFILFTLFTFFASMILDNVTVVLLVTPVALSLAIGLGLNTKLLIIMLTLFSNIGGALTLIGDPPNTLIGLEAEIPFMDFITNLFIPIFSIAILSVIYFAITNWESVKPVHHNLTKTMINLLVIEKIKFNLPNKDLTKLSIIIFSVIFLTILGFILAPQLSLPIGLIGLLAGILLCFLTAKDVHFMNVIHEVEWDSILFFAALFIQVGALEKVGFLELLTTYITMFADDYVILLLSILWGIGISSMFINNIPFVALMIPVIINIQNDLAGQPNLDLLWWSLALGSCLGGNGTIIGSSAGVLATNIAKKHGVNISFLEYMKYGVPVAIISLVVSSFYLIARVNF